MKKILLTLLCGLSLTNVYAANNASAVVTTKIKPAPVVGKVVASKIKCDGQNPVVDMKITYDGKSYGDIAILLNKEKAPISVDNFISYVKSGFYNGKIFHRVIPGFMIQGGGFDSKMVEAKTKSPIKNEANNGLANDKYTIAMARTQDPDSASAQFFINVKDNNFLNYSENNPGYAVFGTIVGGRNTVDKIAGVPTKDLAMYQNVPVKSVIIKSATLICK
jgi:peptidyl-prolyl cis-trans isomerase B (cyclophilin B)